MKKTSVLVATVVAGAVISIAGAAFSASNLKTDLFNSDGGGGGGGDGIIQQMDQEQQQEEQFRRDLDNEKRHLTDRRNECKNMRSQIKQAKKSGSTAAADLEGRVTALCDSVTAYITQLGAVTDWEEFQDLRSTIQDEINSGFQDLWDLINDLNAESNTLRGIKENKGTCKNFTRQLKEITREAKRAKMDISAISARGQEKVKECEENYRQLQTFVSNKQFEEANDLLQDFFWNSETHEFFQELREEAMACSGISRIVKESAREIKMVRKAIAKFKKMGLDTSVAEDYFAQALDIVAEAKELAKAGTCDRDASESLGEELDEAGSYLEEEMENLKSAAEFGDDEFGDR